MPFPSLPTGAIFNVFRLLVTPFAKRKRNKELEGYYVVHRQNSTKPVVRSPEGTPNFLKLTTSFWNPNRVSIVSKDYDATYRKIWKTWRGTITMIDDSYGRGYYNYMENNEPGEHEIWLVDPGRIRVRVVDKGKANLKEGRDNDPATQQWVKVSGADPLIDKFEEMLKNPNP